MSFTNRLDGHNCVTHLYLVLIASDLKINNHAIMALTAKMRIAAEVINELKGPILNLLSPQSELAPALLKRVKEVVLRDRLYVERLKQHYQLFRKTVEGKHYTAMPGMASKKVGRNDPCPCGSGRKYKYCCMNPRPDS
jgi:uncharacterized protein YecA (UPF0149 family)